MEIRNFVDQRLKKVRQFIADHRQQMAHQGAVVATWRRRGAKKIGPYFLLTCRDQLGRQHSVYLGSEGAVVATTREALRELQALATERRRLAKARKSLRQGLQQARKELSQELQAVGLRRQGSEVRGWSRLKAMSAASAILRPAAGDTVDLAGDLT
jgi:hypothetical protein